MPAFLEQRLPDAIARGSSGGPRAKRAKAYTQAGRLVQQFAWTRPLHRYDISFGIKTRQDFEAVRALWYVVMFPPYYIGFRFRDWADYRVTRETSALAFIGGSQWQLARRYYAPGGAAFYDRPIYKPVAGSVVVYRTRAGATAAIAATIDATTGIATIAGDAGGDAYSWAGEFDVPVTFEDDTMDNIDIDGVAGNELLALPSIKLEELRAIA